MAIVNANMDIMAMGTNAKKVRRMLIYLSYAFVSIVQYRKYILLSNDQRGISTLLIQITHEQSEVHFYNQRWILSGKPFRCMKEE